MCMWRTAGDVRLHSRKRVGTAGKEKHQPVGGIWKESICLQSRQQDEDNVMGHKVGQWSDQFLQILVVILLANINFNCSFEELETTDCFIGYIRREVLSSSKPQFKLILADQVNRYISNSWLLSSHRSFMKLHRLLSISILVIKREPLLLCDSFLSCVYFSYTNCPYKLVC